MQYLTGEMHFQHKLLSDPSWLKRWVHRLNEAGAERSLVETIKAAKTLVAIPPRE